MFDWWDNVMTWGDYIIFLFVFTSFSAFFQALRKN